MPSDPLGVDMRRLTWAVAALSACVLCAGGTNANSAPETTKTTRATKATKATRQALSWLGGQIRAYQRSAWHWQRLMGVRLSPTTGDSLAELGVPGAKTALVRWRHVARTARRQGQHPPHLREFMCIHSYEGSWTDGGAPFWGGLQMNYSFQAAYGARLLRAKGTADHWTPLEQIWTAE